MKEEISQVAIGRSIGVLVLKGLRAKTIISGEKSRSLFLRDI